MFLLAYDLLFQLSVSSRHPQEVIMAQCSLFVHKVGLRPHLFVHHVLKKSFFNTNFKLNIKQK